MLVVEDLDLYYGDAQALSASASAPRKAIVAIVGANGASKDLADPRHRRHAETGTGRMSFKGRQIAGLDSHVVCNLGVGQVAEGRQVFPTLTVHENLLMGGMIPRARARRAENLERMLALFPACGTAWNRLPAHCQAAGSRCWPSRGA